MEVLKEYGEILALYDEIARKRLLPDVLKLDDPQAHDEVLRELEEAGALSDEMNTLPLPVRIKAVLNLARGEGAVAMDVGATLALAEFGLRGYGVVWGDSLLFGEPDRAYGGGKVGKFVGERVSVLGLRGLRWWSGRFAAEEDASPEAHLRLLHYALAAAVGVGLAAYDEALRYSKERKAFGHPIHDYEEIRRFLNEGRAKLEASERTLLMATSEDEIRRAAWQVFDAATFMTEKATQIFGGYGFINEYPVSKYMRDVRMLRSLALPSAYV
ncbi:MAG: hypothetical protein GXO29_06600 [Thermotogae bacterium]|nr:hypothetical protein [Thermotogota bacterium]